ncbi:MAG: hypothetical protein KBT11_04375 [Treponema sp.]|nr:hypothetical protein [Candidatus Treponema equifaecale]
MKRHLENVLFAVLLFFCPLKCFCVDVTPLEMVDKIHWIFETTKGTQNVGNIMSQEDGKNSYIKQVLSFRGILFHSFYENKLLTKSQMNLGFANKMNFFWTDQPDFMHENELNENLRCVEFDFQKLFPIYLTYRSIIEPFVGFSYFEYAVDDLEKGLNGATEMYDYILGGVDYRFILNRRFSGNIFVSYTPLSFYRFDLSTVQFLSYGFEFETDLHPIIVTLFYTGRRSFFQKGRTWFSGVIENTNTSEVGFSLRLSLR